MSGLPISEKELSRVAGIIRSGLRLAAQTGEGCLIRLSICDGFSEQKQKINVGCAPAPRHEDRELVRVYVDIPDAIIAPLCTPLRAEIEPFVIGVGHVRTHDFADGFKIILTDQRNIEHVIPPSDAAKPMMDKPDYDKAFSYLDSAGYKGMK